MCLWRCGLSQNPKRVPKSWCQAGRQSSSQGHPARSPIRHPESVAGSKSHAQPATGPPGPWPGLRVFWPETRLPPPPSCLPLPSPETCLPRESPPSLRVGLLLPSVYSSLTQAVSTLPHPSSPPHSSSAPASPRATCSELRPSRLRPFSFLKPVSSSPSSHPSLCSILSHLCSNGGLASASLHLSSSPTLTPASSPGLGRRPPRSMPPGGLPRWARAKGSAWRPLWAGQRKAAFVVQTGASRGGRRIVHPLAGRGRAAGSGPGWANSNPEARGTEGVCVCWGRSGEWGRAVIRAGRGRRRFKVPGRTGPRPEKPPPSPPAIHCTSTRLAVYYVLGANPFHQASLLTPVLCNPTSIY